MKRPMLSADLADINYDLTRIPYPVLVMPKIDGIRALTAATGLVSRSLKRIPNEHIQSHFINVDSGIDGELVLWDSAKNCPAPYNATESAIMSHDGEPDWRYIVFDYIMDATPYRIRLHHLANYLQYGQLSSRVKFCPYVLASSARELPILHEWNLAAGFEGSILRGVDTPYKHGRSTIREFGMVKWKQWRDDFAVITDFVEEMENTNAPTTNELGLSERSSHSSGLVPKGTLGALTVTHPTLGTFSIGSGFSAAERSSLWIHRHTLIGQRVKFKYLADTTSGYVKPRSPIYLTLRVDT